MSINPTAVLANNDPRLAQVIEQIGPCRLELWSGQDPFEVLVRAIAHQQLTGRAAASIIARFMQLEPSRSFPSPQRVRSLEHEALRRAGFSRAKVATLHDLAEKTLTGVVPSHEEIVRLDDAAIIERCTKVRGIGRWTVEMLLIFGLGRPDVLPVDDLGIRKGLQAVYALPDLPCRQTVNSLGEPWRPYRSTASWYLWRVAELHKNKRTTHVAPGDGLSLSVLETTKRKISSL